jgi:hypothetical protein
VYFHEFKETMVDLIVWTSKIMESFNQKKSMRPFVWLMQNVSEIVEKRKRENVENT